MVTSPDEAAGPSCGAPAELLRLVNQKLLSACERAGRAKQGVEWRIEQCGEPLLCFESLLCLRAAGIRRDAHQPEIIFASAQTCLP